jgi:hypothetical protein
MLFGRSFEDEGLSMMKLALGAVLLLGIGRDQDSAQIQALVK